jgi:hypothetical protein
MAAMISRPAPSSISVTLLAAFAYVRSPSADNKVTLMEFGAEREIIAAMQQHREDGTIRLDAYGALQHLATNVDNKVSLMELGAGREILTALQSTDDPRQYNKKRVRRSGPSRIRIIHNIEECTRIRTMITKSV